MKKKVYMYLMLIVNLTIFLASAESPENSCIDCSVEINNLSIQISELYQEIDYLNLSLINMTLERDYYKNLSDYYQFLYESKEINITHRELINIYNTLNLFKSDLNITNTKIDNIDDRLTIFSLEFGFSIISLAGISVAIIEAALHWRRRRRARNVTSQ